MRCCQGVKDKEVIAGELAAAEEHISKSKFGQILLRRCAPVLMPDLILISETFSASMVTTQEAICAQPHRMWATRQLVHRSVRCAINRGYVLLYI